MKKAYVKVKPKSVKGNLKKTYIIAVAASALLCAFVLSSVFSPDEEIKKENLVEIEEVVPEEISQVSEPMEIEIPAPEETIKIPEIEINAPDEKVEEVATSGQTEMKFIMPVSGEVINEYSGSIPVKSKTMGDWRVHSGIDIKAKKGTNVVAPAGGKVIKASSDRLMGNTVSIEHKDGFVSVIYNLGSIKVKEGNEVKSGDVIGTVGNSSVLESQEDEHAHFEIKKDGKYVNPKNHIN